MKLIIEIPDELFNIFKKHGVMAFDYFNEYDKDQIAIAITHGTPLPKGHGRLKDIDKVERLLDLDKPDNAIAKALKNIIESVPTIIEADKESEAEE